MRDTRDVFIDAVKDHLNGTPDASHPVQFERIAGDLVACTLCGAAVHWDNKWQELHRKNHDDHNKVHGDIETQAHHYTEPPRYR